MSERQDEPAFAAIATSPTGDVYHQTGMTLRDWFAGQALAGMFHHDGWLSTLDGDETEAAHRAYRIANAMLAERSKP